VWQNRQLEKYENAAGGTNESDLAGAVPIRVGSKHQFVRLSTGNNNNYFDFLQVTLTITGIEVVSRQLATEPFLRL
jgi:hypothetical protein